MNKESTDLIRAYLAESRDTITKAMEATNNDDLLLRLLNIRITINTAIGEVTHGGY